MPLQATSGAASYDAFGGGVPFEPTYIEQIFATHLYTGNGSTQTINNGIDLAGKGGLVWAKGRTTLDGPAWNILVDTARGVSKNLSSNATNAQFTASTVTSFNANGFALGDPFEVNQNAASYASWTFREQPKFFDVVTWTGDGTGNGRRLAHNLGSVPGCMIFKRTNLTGNWAVWHRTFSNPTDDYLNLNLTNGIASFTNNWGTSAPTATDFPAGYANGSGDTYVAYLFAHNAGGFGLSGTDNVISCGSYAGTSGASSPVVNLGYEPQWILIKRATGGTGEWLLFDNMRGMPVGGIDRTLRAEISGAEEGAADFLSPTATGFIVDPTLNQFINESGDYIYIAIRRGPMRTPTTGTSVFAPTNIAAGVSSITTGFPVDATLQNGLGGGPTYVFDRLRGSTTTSAPYLRTTTTDAESNISVGLGYDSNTTIYNTNNWSGGLYLNFRRAPGFFDEVCYTGTGADQRDIAHNLTSTPGFLIYKRTNSTSDWGVVAQVGSTAREFRLNTTAAGVNTGLPIQDWFATSTTFRVGAGWLTSGSGFNVSGATYVAYFFASAPGVSKVGSYTGTGATQTIDCGFTAGSRFVLIKRADSTGDWYVWDSARGIVAGNDPYLLLNSTAAEVTSTDYIDTASTGFEISSTAPAAINASGGTYIFLAIA